MNQNIKNSRNQQQSRQKCGQAQDQCPHDQSSTSQSQNSCPKNSRSRKQSSENG